MRPNGLRSQYWRSSQSFLRSYDSPASQGAASYGVPSVPLLDGLVFARADGSPLRPQWVLDQLRHRTAELDLPRIGLHDLRHSAATIMIASGVPLAIVSKTLRHSTLSTTLNTYGHLLTYAAHDAVTALGAALDRADADGHEHHTALVAA
jgi:integrase